MAHSTARPWLRAAVISLVLSALVTLGAAIIFGGGAYYVPPVVSEKIDSMAYRDAIKYINERSQSMSGWEAFVNGAQSWWYWRQLLEGWSLLFAFGFLSCAAFIRWGRAETAPSNSTPHADARRTATPDQPSSARAGERER
jgi:hypothetical protein